jgi:glutaredoxin
MAKRALSDWGFEYQEVNVEQDAAAFSRLQEMGLRTVPQIFVTEDQIIPGGCNGLLMLGKQGLTEQLDRTSINTQDLGDI